MIRLYVAAALSTLSALVACTPSAHAIAPCNPVAADGPVTVDVVGEGGRSLDTFGKRGQVWVLGRYGDRYSIRVRNRSAERIEAVVSVDGLDAIDGKPASFDKRGYLIQPWGEVVIDGFRVSNADVATFRFASVADSYAAKTGSARNVGVIGVAVFRERVPPPSPRPWPVEPEAELRDDNRYYGDSGLGRRQEGGAAPAPTSAPDGKSADAPRSAEKAPTSRPGLGTEFGERRYAPVRQVAFERRSSRPTTTLSLRYDDARGLESQGVDLSCGSNDAWRRRTAQPFAETGSYAAPPPGWE